ncbi:MAG: hypothetical protein LBB23_00050 [Rickettsiales bacterium]|jgi:hypothetical protein|nr:hypothetical protein [Rickettsiales bacterium]
MLIESIGIIAGVIVAISFIFKDRRLRLLNIIGAALFILYGMFIESYPIMGLNAFAIIVNAYKVLEFNYANRKNRSSK